ncbi:asparaginase [Oceanicoccus sagamiensis]|uniref:L-asparaginase n=1 Tax=Oceanicoccus sagamiensis TaxID=716816 RepID=A0A1X9NFQ6_9GAMM|nr:asparaginase [Oceanicoccus sagamiensis]ARN73787.1 hypothetical protein BST96_06470 [Oceanicoccus sagamiensis]
MQTPNIHLLTTGGTIAMKRDPASGRVLPALDADALLATVPALADSATISVHPFSNQPSAYMGPPQWYALYNKLQTLLADTNVNGVVISHGTDTLEETAFFLACCLATDKPVVLTGAQRHASEADSDGPRNLLQAVNVAASPMARGRGVLVVINQHIFSARDVQKIHTEQLAGFAAGEAGCLGSIAQQAVYFYQPPQPHKTLPLTHADFPRVDIVAMYGGADGALIDAAVAAGAKGLVIQALGAGNTNTEQYRAIASAIKAGVCVAVSSRVQQGRVGPVYGYQGGGQTLQELGCLMAADLSPQKARIALILGLHNGLSAPAIQALFY